MKLSTCGTATTVLCAVSVLSNLAAAPAAAPPANILREYTRPHALVDVDQGIKDRQ